MRQLHRLLAAPLACVAASALAQPKDSAFTFYGAYRDGGSFVETGTEQKLRIESSAAYAASLDLALDGNRQLQFYVSHQRSRLRLGPVTTTAPQAVAPPGRLPMKVTYLHLGGTNYFDGPIGFGPYVMGGLGATLFQPGLDGYSDELRPSMNLGVGYQVPLAERLALRLEARGYFTLVNSSGGLFCSGGCIVAIKGDSLTQGEIQLGLSLRF